MERGKKERNPVTLFLGLSALILLTAYVNILPPDTLASVGGFFALLAVTLYLLLTHALTNVRHIILITSGVVLLLLLRFLGLKHPLYMILLAASVIAAEYLWKERS